MVLVRQTLPRQQEIRNVLHAYTTGRSHEMAGEEEQLEERSKADTAATTSAATDTPKANVSSTAPASDSKLALSKSLQAALLTTAGLTQDQFQKIWDDACKNIGWENWIIY